jgi:hypothetical protein
MTARNIKKNSSGLLTIGYNSKDSRLDYKAEENKFVEFTAEIELTNYSNEKKTFHLMIDNPFFREDGIAEINFYTFEGKQAIFELNSYETKSYLLSLDKYHIVGGREFQSGAGSGMIQEIVLMNDKGNKVRLDSNNFFGIELGRHYRD